MKKIGLLLVFIFSMSLNAHKKINKEAIEINRFTVYFFLSETCPACQSYTLKMKELYTKYSAKGISFLAVFPNYFSTDLTIKEFKKKYGIEFKCTKDVNGNLLTKCKATITPEVFVANQSGEVVYSGRIDDAFFTVGKRRKVVSTNELEEAIVACINGKAIFNKKTQAVGCLISTKENK